MTRSLLAGIRPQLPQSIAARLAGTGREAILRVDIAGAAARRPLLSELAAAIPGRFRLVHGGIDNIQGQPVGTLFLGSETASGGVTEVVEFLNARNARVELLGYVTDDV